MLCSLANRRPTRFVAACEVLTRTQGRSLSWKGIGAMKPSTALTALFSLTALSMLMGSTLARSDDSAAPLTREPLYTVYAHPDESLRVSGSNDIYRSKISDDPLAPLGPRPLDPIDLFGDAGYYLYDLDSWAMVASGPSIRPYRFRTYSLFGSGFNEASLNPLTMRSESERRYVSPASGTRPSWSYSGWRF
jgi:hypothetical protein